MPKKNIETRANYVYFSPITTRWMDNDIYGHVNNVTYYSYFDTAANNYLIKEGGLNIADAPVIGVVVNSMCDYNSSITYPEEIEAGLRVDRLGRSSVQYGIAIFKAGDDNASAQGHFVHVFVDRNSQTPVPIPENIHTALTQLLL